MKKLVKKIKYTAKIELLSGLHIGGTNTTMSIGGVDNFIIRNPIDLKPYIPGSSLKGKMRSLLELAYGEHENGSVSTDSKSHCGALFGVSASSKDSNAHASRLIVRDAMWIDTDVKFDKTDLYLAESKTEVNIDRITSRANPRTQERVPRGAQFLFEAVLNIFDGESEEQYDKDIRKAISLLEDDYLGGHGSRGYGRIRFIDIKTESKSAANY
jgi:CRISPR-associated protein Csm3